MKNTLKKASLSNGHLFLRRPLSNGHLFLISFEMATFDKKTFIGKLDRQNENVKKGYKILEKFYSTDFKRTHVSEIIDGESIEIKPDNMVISNPIIETQPKSEIINQLFEKWCNLKPYKYQVETINRILELEEQQEHIDPETKKTVVSNIYQISLPIGSGKSLCFEFLSLFFRTVPVHPIIVSTDGKSLPRHDQLQFEKYPYYYENGAYIKEDANAVQAITYSQELQRPCTVILTHHHLMVQMYNYFHSDFKAPIIEKTRFAYVDYHGFVEQKNINFNPDNFDIMVVVADDENVNKLIEMSYKRPFARVIVDDYTNMTDLAYFKQILAASTVLVSGHGFERDADHVPASYYSLKNVPARKITLVGNPNEVYEGVVRDNIITGELMGCASEFDIYHFVEGVEAMCRRLTKPKNAKIKDDYTPVNLFAEIKENGVIENYIKYGFFLKNMAMFREKLPELISDIKADPNFPKERVSNFIKWWKNSNDLDFKTIITTPTTLGNNGSISNTLVDYNCSICHKTKEQHLGFGVILGCCGTFVCANCIKKATTHEIRNNEEGLLVADDYYCCCCRGKNPRVYFNSTKQSSSSNLYSYILAQQYFEVDELENNFPIDYYFYMLRNGFKIRSKYCCGKAINIANDISFGLIKKDVFESKTIPNINKIKSIDILGGQVLVGLSNVYRELKIAIPNDSIIVLYRVKQIIKPRLTQMFEQMKKQPGSPFTTCKLMFIDSISSVIGIQANIVGIIVWQEDETNKTMNVAQLVGRCLRISTFGQKLLFYLSLNRNAYD